VRLLLLLYCWASPEYPHSPAAHRNKPTIMRMMGRTSHCEDEPRAGQRKAARGKVGVRTMISGFRRKGLWEGSVEGFLVLRRGLRGEGLAVAIFQRIKNMEEALNGDGDGGGGEMSIEGMSFRRKAKVHADLG
jgi:hypothetical protein